MAEPIEPEFLTTEETSALLRTPVATLYAWRSQGDGPPASKVGKRLLYPRVKLLAWVASREGLAR